MTIQAPQEVFLIHHGKQDYLQIAAVETQKSGNKVILIGDDAKTGKMCSAYYNDSLIDLPNYQEFEAQYVHMSSAPRVFELLCFKRYFYLYAIAKQRGLNQFWMIDSDAIVLQDLSKITNDFLLSNNYCAGISTRHQSKYDWASSPHTSFWTLKGLEDFIYFLKNLHKGESRSLLDEKYQWHLNNDIPGGICDMTALFLWQKNKGDVFNLAKAHHEGFPLFDNNLNEDGNMSAREFLMVKNVRLKKITHEGAQYWAYLQKDGSQISVAALHFQGRAKSCMATFQKTQEITYWSYAPYSFVQYVQKRKNSLRRKVKKLFFCFTQ
jgi:hypothetical protein